MRTAIAAMLASLSAAGCAATTPPSSPPLAAADPSVGIRPASYEPVTAGYRHREPVDPKDWRKLNQDLAPAPEGAGS